jgi:DNA polymerase I-like protein with 3'-5' exonuclease and polymerase domains
MAERKLIAVDTLEKFDKLIDHLLTKKVVAYDTESNSISPFIEDPKFLGFSFSCSSTIAYYVPFRAADPDTIQGGVDTVVNDLVTPEEETYMLDRIYEILSNPGILKVAFNVQHEMKWFRKITGKELPTGQTFDPMLACSTVTMGMPMKRSLKNLTNMHIGGDLENYDSGLKNYKIRYCRDKGIKQDDFNYSFIPLEVMVPYAALDALATYLLYFVFANKLDDLGLYGTFRNRTQIPAEWSANGMEWAGIQIDVDYLNDLEQKVSAQLEQLYEEILAYPEVQKATALIRQGEANKKNRKNLILWQNRRNELIAKRESGTFTKRDQKYLDSVEDKIQNKLVSSKDYDDLEFNISSNDHLLVLIKDVLKIKLIKKTKGGQFSVDKQVFSKIKSRHTVLERIAFYNLRSTLHGTFIVGILDKKLNDRLHGNYNFHVVRSGRLSSSNPNHQNFPDLPEFNRIIVAREGYTLVYWDLSNIEARLAAILAGDSNLIEIFSKPGGDMHSATAKLVFDLPESVEEISAIAEADKNSLYYKYRKICKTVNFLAIYGGTYKALMRSVESLSEEEAKVYMNGFWDSYPELRVYFRNLRNNISKTKTVSCINGRKRWMDKRVLSNKYMTAKEVNSMCNTTIQGPASDIELEMAQKADKEAKARGLDVTPVRIVHDSCMFEVKDENVQAFLDILGPLTRTWPEWVRDTRGVLLESKIEVGKFFDQMETVAA